jgi:hypothetical protein
MQSAKIEGSDDDDDDELISAHPLIHSAGHHRGRSVDIMTTSPMSSLPVDLLPSIFQFLSSACS